MKINSLKRDFITYKECGKKARKNLIPVVFALGNLNNFRSFDMKSVDSSEENLKLTDKIKALPPLLKYFIDIEIRGRCSSDRYKKEYILAIKDRVEERIRSFITTGIEHSDRLSPGNSVNGQEALMNLVGIQHNSYTSRDSKYFSGGYYYLAEFDTASAGTGYTMNPIFSLMVKPEYVTYLRKCQLFNLEIDNDIFEFWVDEKFDTKDTLYANLRSLYRKSVLPVLKENSIPIVPKKDMYYEMFQCFRMPDFSTIEDMEAWKISKAETFMSKFKKYVDGEEVVFKIEDASEYTMYLHSCGESKLQVVKYIKDFATLGLKECKDIVDNANTIKGCFLVTKTQEEVEAFIGQLGEVGATCTYRQGNQLSELEEIEEGDYVVIIDDSDDGFPEGTVGVVTDIDRDDDLDYEIEFDSSRYWHARRNIRKATQYEIDQFNSPTYDGEELVSIDSLENPSEAQFRVGDTVEIIGNTNSSCNRVGEIGRITEVGESYARVVVDPRRHYGNMSLFSEIRRVEPTIATSTHEVSTISSEERAELADIQSELASSRQSNPTRNEFNVEMFREFVAQLASAPTSIIDEPF